MIIVLISVASVLLIVLIVAIIMLLGANMPGNVETNKALKGVSVSGVDISGMTQTEALAALSNASDDLLKKIEISVRIGGEISKYTAKDLGLKAEYEAAVAQALAYGYIPVRRRNANRWRRRPEPKALILL